MRKTDQSKKRRGLFWLLWPLMIIACTLILNVIINRSFEVTYYRLFSEKLSSDIRIALLTDLHQTVYGEKNSELLDEIRGQSPDLILIAGDSINRRSPDLDYIIDLCRELTEIAPVYYGLGNHENEVIYGDDLNIEMLEKRADELPLDKEDLSPLIEDDRLLTELGKMGVHVLQNQAEEVDINGDRLLIGGISTNESSFWPYSGNFVTGFAEADDSFFKLLISHRPEPVMRYIPDYDIDLVVSGHNHGGQVRIPGIGGLFSPDEGFFPEYDGGYYRTHKLRMIVSRGLGNHSLFPRVFNRPELVIIDIN